MRKYLAVFAVSWQNGFVYRLNFWLWRIRSVILILTVYFLWEAVFQNNLSVAGYDREKILTYVFLTLVLRSVILGQRSIDAAGEIADGRLANYLVKPINYHLYWFTRDLADKLLNIIFAVLETIVLYLILRPPLFGQSDPLVLAGFLVAGIIAILLNFILGSITSSLSFWTTNNAWGFWFLYFIFQEFFGGVVYPLDIFPETISRVIMLLPFAYLLFFPANVYLGKVAWPDYFWGLTVALFWLTISFIALQRLYRAGVKSYQAEGR